MASFTATSVVLDFLCSENNGALRRRPYTRILKVFHMQLHRLLIGHGQVFQALSQYGHRHSKGRTSLKETKESTKFYKTMRISQRGRTYQLVKIME